MKIDKFAAKGFALKSVISIPFLIALGVIYRAGERMDDRIDEQMERERQEANPQIAPSEQ